jgi:hypothetical protein
VRRKLLIALGVLTLILVILPFVMDGEDVELDDARREALVEQGHTFAALPDEVMPRVVQWLGQSST